LPPSDEFSQLQSNSFGRNVFVHHVLENFAPVGLGGFSNKGHLTIFEFSNEIQIRPLVIYPGLLPLTGAGIE
jgi:hypothetical protein